MVSKVRRFNVNEKSTDSSSAAAAETGSTSSSLRSTRSAGRNAPKKTRSGQLLEMLANLGGPRRRKFTVSFAALEKDEHFYTMTRHEYTEEEQLACWISDDELERSIGKCKFVVEKELTRPTGKKGYCTRGLEHLFDRETVHTHRQEAYEAVLQAQDDRSSDENIARLYAEASIRCVKEAIKLAEQDANAAKRYLADVAKALYGRNKEDKSKQQQRKPRRNPSPDLGGMLQRVGSESGLSTASGGTSTSARSKVRVAPQRNATFDGSQKNGSALSAAANRNMQREMGLRTTASGKLVRHAPGRASSEKPSRRTSESSHSTSVTAAPASFETPQSTERKSLPSSGTSADKERQTRSPNRRARSPSARAKSPNRRSVSPNRKTRTPGRPNNQSPRSTPKRSKSDATQYKTSPRRTGSETMNPRTPRRSAGEMLSSSSSATATPKATPRRTRSELQGNSRTPRRTHTSDTPNSKSRPRRTMSDLVRKESASSMNSSITMSQLTSLDEDAMSTGNNSSAGANFRARHFPDINLNNSIPLHKRRSDRAERQRARSSAASGTGRSSRSSEGSQSMSRTTKQAVKELDEEGGVGLDDKEGSNGSIVSNQRLGSNGSAVAAENDTNRDGQEEQGQAEKIDQIEEEKQELKPIPAMALWEEKAEGRPTRKDLGRRERGNSESPTRRGGRRGEQQQQQQQQEGTGQDSSSGGSRRPRGTGSRHESPGTRRRGVDRGGSSHGQEPSSSSAHRRRKIAKGTLERNDSRGE